MSSSISGSSGSIALGSILISLISPAPVALTVTMPPPAVASTVSFASSSCAFCICSCICCTCCISLFMSMPSMPVVLLVPLARVEGLLHQLDDLLLARAARRPRPASRRRPRRPRRRARAGGRSPRRARRASSVAFFGSSASCRWNEALARELDRQRVVGEARGVRLAAARTRSGSTLLDGREDRPLPGLLELLELQRRAARRRGALQRRPRAGTRLRDGPWDVRRAGHARASRAARAGRRVDSRERSAPGPRHLHERELERQARVAALAHVLDRDREQVARAAAPSPRRAGSPARAAARASPRSPAASPAPRPCAGRAAGGAGARAGR